MPAQYPQRRVRRDAALAAGRQGVLCPCTQPARWCRSDQVGVRTPVDQIHLGGAENIVTGAHRPAAVGGARRHYREGTEGVVSPFSAVASLRFMAFGDLDPVVGVDAVGSNRAVLKYRQIARYRDAVTADRPPRHRDRLGGIQALTEQLGGITFGLALGALTLAVAVVVKSKVPRIGSGLADALSAQQPLVDAVNADTAIRMPVDHCHLGAPIPSRVSRSGCLHAPQ